MLKRLGLVLALIAGTMGAAFGQAGQLPSGYVWGNSTASQAPAGPAPQSAMLDRGFCATQGAVLIRNASGWICLTPGTNGGPLITGGAGANPSWATRSGTTSVFATVNGAITDGHCLSANGGNIVDSGVIGCGAAGGSGTVSAGLAGQLAYYPTNGTGVAGIVGTAFFDTVLCATNGSFAVRIGGVWQCLANVGGGLNAIAFGADPTGAADSTAAVNAAIATLSGNCGAIYFPPGRYKFNSRLTVTLSGAVCSFAIKGAGQDVVTLFWPNAAGGLQVVYSSPAHSFHASDVTFTTGQNGGGNGIELDQSSFLAAFEQTDIHRVTFRGDNNHGSLGSNYWTIAALVNGVSGTSWDTITVYGTNSGTGILFQGVAGSAGYSIYHNVSKGTFNNLAFGIVYGTYAQGVTISQSNFQNGQTPIYVPPGAIGLSQFNIFDNQLAGTLNQIEVNSNVGQITIRGNDMFADGSNGCVFLNAASGFNIIGNFCNPGGSPSSPNGFVIANSVAGSLGTIIGNQLSGLGTAIWLESTAANVYVNGNSFIGNTTNVLDQGTGDAIVDVASTADILSGRANKLIDAAGTFASQGYFPLTDVPGGTVTPNFNNGSNFLLFMTGAGNTRVLGNPTNAHNGSGCIQLVQSGSGNNAVTLGTSWRYPGGSGAFSTSTGASQVDIACYTVSDPSNIYIPALAKNVVH